MPNTEAIRFAETGGPEVLQITGSNWPGRPGAGRHYASGVNFIDTYHRSGLYPVELPFVPGSEGAGIEVVGADVTDVAGRPRWWSACRSYAGRVLPDGGLDADPRRGQPPGDRRRAPPPRHDRALPGFDTNRPTRRPVSDPRSSRRNGRLLVQMAKIRGLRWCDCRLAREGRTRAVGRRRSCRPHNEVDLVEGVEAAVGTNAIDVVFDGVGAATFDAGIHLRSSRHDKDSQFHPVPYCRSRRW